MQTIAEKRRGRNIYLDLFRFFLAFMIICIHLTGDTYAFYPVYRLSVPMFFMISGHLFANSDFQSSSGIKLAANALVRPLELVPTICLIGI